MGQEGRVGSWVRTAAGGPQPAAAGGRPQLCGGTLSRGLQRGLEAEPWGLPAPGSTVVVVPGYRGSPNPPPLFTRRRRTQPGGHGRGRLFQGQQDAITACAVPHASGLCSGRRLFSWQMAEPGRKALGALGPRGGWRLQQRGGCTLGQLGRAEPRGAGQSGWMEKQRPHWGMRVGASQPLTCPPSLEAYQAGAPRPLLGPNRHLPAPGGPPW